jgi:hypothetical protein
VIECLVLVSKLGAHVGVQLKALEQQNREVGGDDDSEEDFELFIYCNVTVLRCYNVIKLPW